MKTFWFQITGLIVLIVVSTFLVFNQVYLRAILVPLFGTTSIETTQPSNNPSNDRLTIIGPDNQTKTELKIEIADTKEKRSKGLGGRQSLASDSGLLFIHDNSQKYTYWMKGMQFPIDIMWIQGDTIADITPNIPPPVEGQTEDTLQRYSSKADVNRVLETNAGFVEANNIQIGDKVIIN